MLIRARSVVLCVSVGVGLGGCLCVSLLQYTDVGISVGVQPLSTNFVYDRPRATMDHPTTWCFSLPDLTSWQS